jgi:hypothetical protein
MRRVHLFSSCLMLVSLMTVPVWADVSKSPAKSPYVAPDGKALLVFIRPRKRLAEEVLYSIVDERGRCIAVIGNDWKVTAPIQPRTQTLMVVAGVAQPQVQLLEVSAAPNHTYVISMRPRVKARSPVELTVVRRKSQPMGAFPSSILESSPFKPDLRECSAWVTSRRKKLAAKGQQAKETWDSDAELRASQTIHRDDGWAEHEILPP